MLRLGLLFLVLSLFLRFGFEFLSVLLGSTLIILIMRGLSLFGLCPCDFFGRWCPFIFFFFDCDGAGWRARRRR